MKQILLLIILIALNLASKNIIEASADPQNDDYQLFGCKVNLKNHFSQTSPLFIEGDKLFRLQNEGENLIFNHNEPIEMFCEEWINFGKN